MACVVFGKGFEGVSAVPVISAFVVAAPWAAVGGGRVGRRGRVGPLGDLM